MKRLFLVALLAVAAFYAYTGEKTLEPLSKTVEASTTAITNAMPSKVGSGKVDSGKVGSGT